MPECRVPMCWEMRCTVLTAAFAGCSRTATSLTFWRFEELTTSGWA